MVNMGRFLECCMVSCVWGYRLYEETGKKGLIFSVAKWVMQHVYQCPPPASELGVTFLPIL